jgi:hypothetical protein
MYNACVMRFVLSLFLFFLGVIHAQDNLEIAMKGLELYSWQDVTTNEWRFTVLPGTNRLKTSEEILASDNYALQELKDRLTQLAAGEQIFWSEGSDTFTLPPKEIVMDVLEFAKTLDINIHLISSQ